MPIVFDEISAEIAPPPDVARAAADGAKPEGGAPDPLDQVRQALALLHERQARLVAD